MFLHLFLSTSCLSPNLVLALVASALVPLVTAQDHGTDAPSSGSDTSGDNGDPAAENAAGASGASGVSTKDQVIIGVVVGVVVLVAIAAGIFYFLRKKRRWDRQTKRYEAISAYRSSVKKQAGAGKDHEMSLRQSRQRESPGSKSQIKVGNEPVESILPVYDPSTYHQHQTSIDSSRGLFSNSANGPDMTGQMSFTSFDLPRQTNAHDHHHHSSQFSATISSPPVQSSRPSDMSSKRVSPSFSEASTEVPTPPPVAGSASRRQARRSKPALARLITNL